MSNLNTKVRLLPFLLAQYYRFIYVDLLVHLSTCLKLQVFGNCFETDNSKKVTGKNKKVYIYIYTYIKTKRRISKSFIKTYKNGILNMYQAYNIYKNHNFSDS